MKLLKYDIKNEVYYIWNNYNFFYRKWNFLLINFSSVSVPLAWQLTIALYRHYSILNIGFVKKNIDPNVGISHSKQSLGYKKIFCVIKFKKYCIIIY